MARNQEGDGTASGLAAPATGGLMRCPACGVSMSEEFARMPHYNTREEFNAAAKHHDPTEFAAWQVSHAAWMKQQGGHQ